jgi:hypothetical protein
MSQYLTPRREQRTSKTPKDIDDSARFTSADAGNAGIASGARELNGSTQSFTLANPSEANLSAGDFIISFSFRRNDTGNQTLLSKYQDASNFWALVFTGADVLSFAAVVGGVIKISVAGTTAIDDGGSTSPWHTVSISVDRDSAANTVLYLDGVDDTAGTPTVSTDSINNTGDLFLGENGASSLFYNGEVATIGIGKGSTLTAAEHTSLYNNGNGQLISGLSPTLQIKYTLYYHANEPTVASNLIDAIGSKDMTAVNSPTLGTAIAVLTAADSSTNDNRGKLVFPGTGTDAAWVTNVAHKTSDVTAKDDDNDNHGLIKGHDLLTCWDTSGRGNHLTLSGFINGFLARTKAVPTGASGKALIFEAIATTGIEYATGGDISDLDFGDTTDFTVEGWLRINRAVSGTPFVLSKHTTGTQKGWEIVIRTSGRLGFFIDDTSNSVSSTDDGTVINDFAWHHFAITFDRDANGTRYIDGVANGTADDISSVGDISNAFNVIMGQRHDLPAGREMRGTMDAIRVYNTVLTAAQVLYRKQVRTGNPTTSGDDPGTANVVAEWGFEDGQRHSDVASGLAGTALRFDGIDDQVDIKAVVSALASDTAGSIVLRARFSVNPSADEYLVAFGDTNADEFIAIWIDSSGLLHAALTDAGTAAWAFDTDVALTSATWTHIALVQNGTIPVLYIDGVLRAITFTVTTDQTKWFADVTGVDNGRLGCLNINSGGNTNFFKGDIDTTSVYNDALTVNEALYLSSNGSSGDDPTAANRVFNMGFDEAEERDLATIEGGFSLNFDGTQDYVDVGNVGAGIKTITMWVKPSDITTRKILNLDGTDQIELDGSGNVAATSFPGTTKIYVNAVETVGPLVVDHWSFIAVTDTTGVDGSTFEVGRVGATDEFDGNIDDVRAYSVVKTQAELYSIYTGTNDTASQVLRLAFDDAHPTTGADGDYVTTWIAQESEALPSELSLSPNLRRLLFLQTDAARKARLRTKPNGISGQPALQFDGVNDFYELTGGLTDLYDFTIAFKTGSSAFGADQTLFAVSHILGDGFYSPCIIDSAGKVNVEFDDDAGINNRVRADTTVLTTNAVYIVQTKVEAGAWVVKINGVTQALTVTAGANMNQINVPNANAATIGALKLTGGISNYFEGLIGAFTIHNQDLTTADENLIKDYFMSKYL